MVKAERLIAKYYQDELMDSRIYSAMAKRAKDRDRAETLEKLSEIEAKHAQFWSDMLARMDRKASPSKLTGLKASFMGFLSRLVGYSLTIRFLELGELAAIKKYTELYRSQSLPEHEQERLKEVIHDEITHEEYFISERLRLKPIFEHVRDTVYGMVDALVEVLAVVIGIASIIGNPVVVALGGIIAGSAGTFSMAAGAYLSAKSQRDIATAKLAKLEIEAEIDPGGASRRLAERYIEKGLQEDDAADIVSRLRKAGRAFIEILKREEVGTMEAELVDARKAARDAGLYYFIASLFPIAPFLMLGMAGPLGIAASIVSSSAVLTVSGMLIGLVTGESPLRKAGEMVGIALGAACLTYTIGTVAKILLGIEVL